MRTDCRHYESRTYGNGEAVRKCVLDLALLPVWRPARPAVRAANSALLAGTQLIVNRRKTRV